MQSTPSSDELPAPASVGKAATDSGHDPSDCEQRLRFETLLADLSARFIHLPKEEVDAAIVDALRRICECLGFDVAFLWQLKTDTPKVFTLTHHYRCVEGPPLTRQLQSADSFPWGLREMLAGRSYRFSSLDDVPQGAERDGETLRYFGVKNALVIPLFAGGDALLGAIGFHDMTTARTWSEALLKRLELVAQVFANVLAHQHFELALRESEERLFLATEAADAGPWVLEANGERFWVTPKIMELFGLPPGDGLDVERFVEMVHPDDRQVVRNAMVETVRSREMRVVEYRFVRPDGQVRWIQSRGRLFGEGEGSRLMGITSDVTTRREQEKALRESGARSAAALDVAALGYYEVRNNDRVTFVDRRVCEIIGVPAEVVEAGGVLGFWMEHIHPEDLPRVTDVRLAVEEAGWDRMTVDYRFLNPVRGTVYIHHLAHVMERDAAGRAVRTIGVMQDVTERTRKEEELNRALEEVRQLRDRLELENVYLQDQMRSETGKHGIIGESEPIRKMLALAVRVAPTDAAVLITGETGTGKELLAQAIHDQSLRKNRVMVKVNCAALPGPLIESELFGREKGAYTGAMSKQVGRFELANGSTIFLDEIGDLPLELQAKLLRVLQDGQFERLGSNCTLTADVRLIAATNQDLSAMVRKGEFREDLFHRLDVFPIEVPPLRARTEDIPALVWRFVAELNSRMGRSVESIAKPTMERLTRYAWPGNVRELRNIIERAMIVSEGRSLRIELPDSKPDDTGGAILSLQDVERKHILKALETTRWRISGKGGAADILGLIPTTLHSRMKKLGIVRPARTL